MFGLSFMEVAVILVLALVVLGPEKIPKVARTLGQWVRMLRRATLDLRRAIDIEGAQTQIKKQLDDLKEATDVKSYLKVEEEEEEWRKEVKEEADSEEPIVHQEDESPSAAPAGAIPAGNEPTEVQLQIKEIFETLEVVPLRVPVAGDVVDGTIGHHALPASPVTLLGTVAGKPVQGGITELMRWLRQEQAQASTKRQRTVKPNVVAVRLPRLRMLERSAKALQRRPIHPIRLPAGVTTASISKVFDLRPEVDGIPKHANGVQADPVGRKAI